MSKSNKKKEAVKKKDPEAKRKRRFVYVSLFIIFLMVFSFVSYGLFSGGNNTSVSNRNVPLQADVFQNSVTGETYWGAYVNGEQFVFMNGVEGYDNNEKMIEVATRVKALNEEDITIKTYVDETYDASDAVFLIEKKLFPALKIHFERVYEKECNNNTLVFTNNLSSYKGTCIVFASERGEEYNDADILTYQMLKE